jgi:hypothetical protein
MGAGGAGALGSIFSPPTGAPPTPQPQPTSQPPQPWQQAFGQQQVRGANSEQNRFNGWMQRALPQPQPAWQPQAASQPQAAWPQAA